MIKIVNGVYGVQRANSKSAPLTLDAKEEARLVALGVAEYVSAPAEAATPEPAKKRGRKKVKE